MSLNDSGSGVPGIGLYLDAFRNAIDGRGNRPLTSAQASELRNAGWTQSVDRSRPGKYQQTVWTSPTGTQTNNDGARAAVRALRQQQGSIPDRMPTPSPSSSPWMAAAAAVSIDDYRKKATRKKIGKAIAKRIPKGLPLWLIARFPWLARMRRYWGPTGAVFVATDVWRARQEIWRRFRHWENKQPSPRYGPVARSPGIDTKGRARIPMRVPNEPYLPTWPIPVPGAPPRVPGPARSPGIRPKTGAAARPAPVDRRRAAPATMPNIQVRVGTIPAPLPARVPAGSSVARATAIVRAAAPYASVLLPFLPLGGQPSKRSKNSFDPVTPYEPEGLTSSQYDPLSFAQTNPDKCRCPKKRKKRSTSSCRNPVTSRRIRKDGNRRFSVITRELKCPASSRKKLSF